MSLQAKIFLCTTNVEYSVSPEYLQFESPFLASNQKDHSKKDLADFGSDLPKFSERLNSECHHHQGLVDHSLYPH